MGHTWDGTGGKRLVEIEDTGHAALFDQMGPVLDELLSRGPD